MRSRTQLTQRIQNMGVLFTGISLASDFVDFSLETGTGRDELVKLLDLVVVAVEQLEKRGLGASGALDAAESELAANACVSAGRTAGDWRRGQTRAVAVATGAYSAVRRGDC